jgi:hypothetical protein
MNTQEPGRRVHLGFAIASVEFYRINGFFIPTDQMDNGTVGRPAEWGLSFNFRFD